MIAIAATVAAIVADATAETVRVENTIPPATERERNPHRRCPLCQILERSTQVCFEYENNRIETI